jgi:hypothetical protein
MASLTPNTRALVSIVNYRTAPLTVGCLRSLATEVGVDARVVVVDNDSRDGSADAIEAAIDENGWGGWARVVRAPSNGGFSSGNNQAISAARGHGIVPEYVLLLNPDTVVQPGCLRALLDFMDGHPGVGIAGGQVLNADGSVRRSAFRFHSALGELERMARLGPVSRFMARVSVSYPPPGVPAPADWVSGANMIIRSRVLDDIGLMDEDYFLYYEETDMCLRARRSGWSCWYVPSSKIVHLVGQSTGVTGPQGLTRRVPRYWFESRRRFFVKNHGAVYALAADLAWLAGFSVAALRRRVLGRGATDPPSLLWDFLKFTLRFPPLLDHAHARATTASP